MFLYKSFCQTRTEQSLRLGSGMMAFVLAMPSPAGVVILISIVHALLLASVRSWLGFIMTICRQTQCLDVRRRCGNVVDTYKCVHVNSCATQRTTWHRSPPLSGDVECHYDSAQVVVATCLRLTYLACSGLPRYSQQATQNDRPQTLTLATPLSSCTDVPQLGSVYNVRLSSSLH